MKKVFLSVLALTISQSLLAADIICPPINIIKSVKFTNAKKIPWVAGSGNKGLWAMTSNNFVYQGETWNVWYTNLTSATNEAQVIQEGKTHFDQKQLNQPVKEVSRKSTDCTYTLDSDNETVTASNPPNPPLPDLPKINSNNQSNIQNKNITVKNIQGNWKHDNSSVSITVKGSTYTFCNENNDCANGLLSNDNIEVPNWAVTGKLSNDGRLIVWSNGTQWRRD